eukprot:902075-Pyramimonas_sp.AAC.1
MADLHTHIENTIRCAHDRQHGRCSAIHTFSAHFLCAAAARNESAVGTPSNVQMQRCNIMSVASPLLLAPLRRRRHALLHGEDGSVEVFRLQWGKGRS